MRKITVVTFLLIFGIIATYACDIKISTDKSEYNINNFVIITVTLSHDHRNCLHESEEPKIKIQGLEMVGKTKFSEIETGTWQIKYKAKIIDNDPIFIAFRECEKGGDEEKINIKVE
ncbi:MAG: hypothetical protein KAT05_14420 [Spirochaetes bacterium]|nr:hypothetical protein [Spirochaetota bacterium]